MQLQKCAFLEREELGSGTNPIPDLGRVTSPDRGRPVMVFLLRGCNCSSSAGALGPLSLWGVWLGEGSTCCFCGAEGGGGRGGGVVTAVVLDMVSLRLHTEGGDTEE